MNQLDCSCSCGSTGNATVTASSLLILLLPLTCNRLSRSPPPRFPKAGFQLHPLDWTANRAHQHATNLPRSAQGPVELHETAGRTADTLTYSGEAGLRAITGWLKDLADTPQVIKRQPEKS
jgi:hypothetical protein